MYYLMLSRKKPVLVPYSLKWRDFAWLIAFGLLAVIIFLVSSSKANAQMHSQSKVDFVTYQADSSFSISIPDYLVQVNDLHPQALLQFKNIFNETYLMVVAEGKSEAQHSNVEQLEEHFKANLLFNGGLLTNQVELNIHNCKSFQNEAEWTVNGEPLAYLITFIETPYTLYKIYCWTLASQKDYLNHFKQASNSFVVHKNYQTKI
jgi:hypothetical protein